MVERCSFKHMMMAHPRENYNDGAYDEDKEYNDDSAGVAHGCDDYDPDATHDEIGP